ncbi:hypothetical protein [Lacisediminihabitans changchengi]|uniref:Bacterial Ig-like domain-containing protein n=1 Tax=Lacisediminihabitans changchengi TaxID=2787634 RepID=A0A934SIG0_9MICO|nr:hypothetical protein [Lacisediminihabitans changchengi]MBK4347257.1 hypothetical protein [Lacisediminihabitans changchengi]
MVQQSLSNVRRRSFRERGASGLGRFLILAAAIALAPALIAAAPSPSPDEGATPSPSPTAGPLAVTISAPAFSPTNAVAVSGQKDADSSIRVINGGVINGGATSGGTLCSIPRNGDVTWNCIVSLASGADIVLTAIEDLDGSTGSAQSDPIDVLGAPTIDGNGGLSPGLVTGLGFAGSTVTVAVGGDPTGGCTSPVTATGYWSCSLAVPSGTWAVTATQTNPALGGGASSSVSGSVNVTIDKNAPAAPVVTSPRTGTVVTAPTVTFRGTGEDGGRIDVYLSNVPICSTTVSGTEWSCTTRSSATGTYAVLAVQRDQAGNYAAPSGEVRVSFAPAPTASAAPTPSAPGQTTAPADPAPSPSSPAAPSLPNDPRSGGSTDAGASPPDWQAPTAFGADIPTVAVSISRGTWALALLAALAFLVLIALPMRLLATTLHGRRLPRSPRVLGRNRRGESVPEPSAPAAPWIGIVASLAAATALIVLSTRVSDEVRYLRLTIAVAVGLVILNAAVMVVGRVVGARFGVSGRPRLLIVMLVGALLTAVLSRVTGVDPPVVAGALLGMAFVGRMPARPRGAVRLAEVASVVVLGVIAWVLVGPLAAASGFWAEFGRELCTTVALAGIGSALIMVLPIANLPGRVILEWSPSIWIATAAVVATIAGTVFVGTGVGFPVLASLAVAAGFSALSLGLWAWLRFSESLA